MRTKQPSKKKFIDMLKESRSLEELNGIMGNIKIPYTKGEGNRFSDNTWLVRKAKNRYVEVKFSTYSKPFPAAVAKVYYLLKAYGYIDQKPHDAAQVAFNYRVYAKELCLMLPKAQSLLSLREKDIEHFVAINSSIQTKSAYKKLHPFRVVSKNLRDMVPGFLRISEAALTGPKYKDLVKTYYATEKRRKFEGSPRPQYPLEDLAIMMPVAIELIEHGENTLDFIEHLNSINYFNASTYLENAKYTQVTGAIRSFKKEISDPVLNKLIKEVKATDSNFLYNKKGRTVGQTFGNIRTTINNRILLIESACVIVSLVLSAMRRGELAELPRQLKIDGGDDQILHKVIFKTSASLEGDRHDIPMPEIGVKALRFLSGLAFARDRKKEGTIITNVGKNTDFRGDSSPALDVRVSEIIAKLPESLNLTPLSSHQLRHVMSYLVMQVVGKEGLEIIRYLLGHTSILMTLTYLSRINPYFRDSLEEITKIQSKENLEALYLNMQKGKKVYGAKAAQFNGIINEDMIDIMYEYWGKKIDEGWMMILMTPMAMCMHDLNNPGEMKCQRGLDTSDLIGVIPAPVRCESGCSSGLYLEDHIVKMMALAENAGEELQNDEMFRRLGENIFFNPDDFSIVKESGYKSIIDKYKEDQRKAI